MYTLAVDPGLRKSGFALFNNASRLVSAGLVEPDSEACLPPHLLWREMARRLFNMVPPSHSPLIRCLVCEFPQIYTAWSKSKGDPNDLLHIPAVVGALTTYPWYEISVYKPDEWKGQAPKSVTQARAKKILSSDERIVIILPKAKKKQEDVWDAVGLGLHHLKRTITQPSPRP